MHLKPGSDAFESIASFAVELDGHLSAGNEALRMYLSHAKIRLWCEPAEEHANDVRVRVSAMDSWPLEDVSDVFMISLTLRSYGIKLGEFMSGEGGSCLIKRRHFILIKSKNKAN